MLNGCLKQGKKSELRFYGVFFLLGMEMERMPLLSAAPLHANTPIFSEACAGG